MRSKHVFLGVVILALFFTMGIIQQCEEEKEDDENIVNVQLNSSCESCHTDNAALETLAEAEETGDDEDAGEG